MVPIVELARTKDAIAVKVHVRCRGCLTEAFPLASLDRPPPGFSAKAAFYRQKMWQRIPFTCEGCGHPSAILEGLDYAIADDFVDRTDPYPQLPPSRLQRLALQNESTAKASDKSNRPA